MRIIGIGWLVILVLTAWAPPIAAFAPPPAPRALGAAPLGVTPAAQNVRLQQPTRTAVLPSATPSPTTTPLPLLGGAPAPRMEGELAMRTYSIDFYRLKGAIDAATIQGLALAAESAIITASQELGAPLAGRVSVRFEPPQSGPCAIRGLTLSNERMIRLYYAPNSDPKRIVALLAHEFFHQLQRDYYGETAHRRSDTILLEGMATWGSRAYFREPNGQYSYQARVQEALQDGALLPLATSLERDCRTTTRVNIYNEWASFVEFLLTTYGREEFDAVYSASKGRAPGSANYRGVYGKSLPELEREWIAWLQGR